MIFVARTENWYGVRYMTFFYFLCLIIYNQYHSDLFGHSLEYYSSEWVLTNCKGTVVEMRTVRYDTVQSAFLAHQRTMMDDLRFYVLFNSVSIISGRLGVDNEMLCAMELRLRLRIFRIERRSNSVR